MDPIERIRTALRPHKTALLDHAVYGEIDDVDSLRRFMEHHVYAVWDFMSLLKSLQRRLTCVTIPWLPPADPRAARLVNEIVLAEETDDDGRGGFLSHFGLYRRAMHRGGADTTAIDRFLAELSRGRTVAEAMDAVSAPRGVRRFVTATFDVIAGDSLPAVAAAFTFGREDLLPQVFVKLVERLDAQADGRLDDFRYYLDRHIGLDGDEHGPMATQLLESLCGDDEQAWRTAEAAALASLDARRILWDETLVAIRRGKSPEPHVVLGSRSI